MLRPGLRHIPPIGLLWRRLARRAEFRFWQRALAEQRFQDEDREWLFTDAVGLERGFYRDKRILDLGCGPRDELAWADHAKSRVGLDPLAERYRDLLGGHAEMDLVAGSGEHMPFPEQSFDVVSSLNSLDHTDDVLRVAAEVKRVLKPRGTFLLITDVGHRARLTEPQVFSWDVVDLFGPELRLIYQRRYRDTGRGIDQSVADADELPDDELGPGVLVARFEKEERVT
jgi:SAM-dependent methyltransferase